MSELSPFPKWKPPKGKRRLPHTDEESHPLLLAREAWAVTRVVGWEQRGLQTKDYDFRSWALGPGAVPTGAADGHIGLRLGAVYEYAREGRKLRSLLLLADPSRKREPWEDVYDLVFEGLTESAAEAALGEMYHALARLAEPLAANLSFAEVWRTQRKLAEAAMADGRLWRELRLRGIASTAKLHRGSAVELAHASEADIATTAQTLWWGGSAARDVEALQNDAHAQTLPRRIVEGKEVIALKVDWANYRDEHIKEEFGRLVSWLRRTKAGGGTVLPEPKRQSGKGRSSELDGALANLRAMRLLHEHKHVAKAVVMARQAGNQNVSDENFYRAAKAGRAEFERVFPFEGKPWHHRTPGRSKGRWV